MDFHPADVIISLINIAVLFILLRFILWKHVIRFLSEREKRVSDELENVKSQQLEAEALRAEYDEKIVGLKERGADLLRESQAKACEESEKILKETRDRAQLMVSDAEERIAQEQVQALEKLNLEVAHIATDMAARILERDVSPEDSINVVDDFFRDAQG